jgi:hypothetical protein
VLDNPDELYREPPQIPGWTTRWDGRLYLASRKGDVLPDYQLSDYQRDNACSTEVEARTEAELLLLCCAARVHADLVAAAQALTGPDPAPWPTTDTAIRSASQVITVTARALRKELTR